MAGEEWGEEMKRITRREAALLWNMQAPLEMDAKPVPAKRKADPNAPKEWRDVQSPCIKWLRDYQKFHKNLEFLATLTESKRDEIRAAVAKRMGLKRGPHDVLLFRAYADHCRIMWVEFKLPGKDLSDEQKTWGAWFEACGVSWRRCDNLQDFQRIVEGFMV